jgi:F0F1-type ATP synthase membrane subunit b/b'
MPQLDKFTYFSQVFWVFLLFVTFYLLLVKNLLPTLAGVLKVRRKRIERLGADADALHSEVETIQDRFDSLILNSAVEARGLVQKSAGAQDSFRIDSVKHTNSSGIRQGNETFLGTLGGLSLAKERLS